MSTQKAKFELFTRLQALGFTYEEAHALRRIEMTLHRWAEEMCNGTIQRDYDTPGMDGKPFRIWSNSQGEYNRGPIADREKGALKRLGKIVADRNNRLTESERGTDFIVPYHQTDPRGCALYLVRPYEANGVSLEQSYTNGLAVTA